MLQGRLGADGPVVLVTLPAASLRVTARLTADQPFGVYCAGGASPLTQRQVVALHRLLKGGPPRGRLLLQADMPAGAGAGSSTAALLAVAGVFAAAAGRPLPGTDRLAQICLALEGATDPLMYADPARLLWAPREARSMALLPRMPALEIVGGFLGPRQRTDPADCRFADIADLVAGWAPAADRGDLATLAALATESARRNARCRGGPDLRPMTALADRLGAIGVAAAHTGSARGLIFAPGGGRRAEPETALRSLGVRAITRFRLAGPARLG